jgi:hypothetical protein
MYALWQSDVKSGDQITQMQNVIWLEASHKILDKIYVTVMYTIYNIESLECV